MPYNRALQFKVANRGDFSAFVYFLFVMAMISALLSPLAFPMVIFTAFLFGAGRFLFTLRFSKLSEVKLISVIFPTGQVTIESHDNHIIKGFLTGQQWCTSLAAVLRYKDEGAVKRVVILSGQQDANDYRRLTVCLQQKVCNDATSDDVSSAAL